jgi:hypothetical protein
MLSNVADMTTALAAMDGDGHVVTPALVGCLSPYTREHIRRFGQYVLDMGDLPPPLRSAATAVRGRSVRIFARILKPTPRRPDCCSIPSSIRWRRP